jgi:cardiolipin synthase
LGFAAGITDGLDGALARRFGWQSKLGAMLDPLADKTMMVLGYLVFGLTGAVPLWLALVVLGRDALILLAAIGALLLTSIRDFPPSRWGKLSTFVQLVTCGVVLVVNAWPGPFDWLFWPAILTTAAATIWSGIHYAWTFTRRLAA